MLTYEVVLNVFSDYLRLDTDYEVILTSKGYTVLGWDNHRRDWATVEYCPTPESLQEALLDCYSSFQELHFTNGEREMTTSERKRICDERQMFIDACNRGAKTTE